MLQYFYINIGYLLFPLLLKVHGEISLNICKKSAIPYIQDGSEILVRNLPRSISEHLELEKQSSSPQRNDTQVIFHKTKLSCSHPTKEQTLILRTKNPIYKFASNGMFKGPVLLPNGYSSTNAYCIQSMDEEKIELNVCFINCDHLSTPCIPKCCPKHESFNLDTEECEEIDGKFWEPGIHHHPSNESKHESEKLKVLSAKDMDPHFITKLDFCEIPWAPSPITDEKIRLLHNRVLQVHNGESWENYFSEEFCLDTILNTSQEVIVDLNCSYDDSFDRVLQGWLDAGDIQMIASKVHAIIMILCSIFLIGTLVIYAMLWDKQNIHGWTVVSYIVSLLCLYIYLTVSKLIMSREGMEIGESKQSLGCWINGIFGHFTFLSTFAWLTIINFDIWWKFRNLNPHPMRSKEIIRYFIYSFFALGLPLLIVVVGLVLEDFERTKNMKPLKCLMKDYKSTGVIIPNYGCNCFMQSKALGVYIYYPTSVLICFNCYFFITTAYKIYQLYQSTKQARSCKAEQEMESMKTICKLFVVMGITWIFELLSFEFNSKSSITETVIWNILDCANISQAIGIFFIFVWKRQILSQLWQKYPSLRSTLRLFKVLPGCKKRKIEYQSSSKMSRKTRNRTKEERLDRSASEKSKSWEVSRGRKLSDTSGTTVLDTNIDL